MANNMYIIKMHRSVGVKLTTAFTLLFTLAFGPICWLEGLGWMPMVVMLVVMLPLIVVTWLHSPQTLMIDRNVLTIGRRVQPVVISLGDVRRVERVESKIVRRSVRTMGNGGMWAYTGKHYHREIGNYQLLATEMRELLLIETDKQKYVISSVDTHLYRMLRECVSQ